MGASEEIDFWLIGLEFVAGLILFIYAVTLLSDALKSLAEEKVKKVLARFTQNRWLGVLSGTVATVVIDSSSVTIIMVIALVNAGLLTFAQSLAVIMGSNIGTTLSSQLYAFDIDQYAPVALLIGFLLSTLAKSERLKHTGTIIFSLGLIFFSLGFIGEAMNPLENYAPFEQFIKNLRNPWLGVLVGAGFTALVQSSSAMMGVVIVMASQGMVPFEVGVSIMLGAEIGTCANTLIATIGRDREAVRAGVFHLLFNICTVLLGVLLIRYLIDFTEYLAPGVSVERKIANAHVLFNVGGVLLFIGFVGSIAKLLHFLVPAKQSALKAA